MKLLAYPKLSTCSRRAMLKKNRRDAYVPRARLLSRLCRELNMDANQVIEQCNRERDYILKNLV